MRVYTANEIQAIIARAFRLGVVAGRVAPRDTMPEPPDIAYVVRHDYGSALQRTAEENPENTA